jgi:hypothetical protein
MRRKIEIDIQKADKNSQQKLREMYDEMLKSTFREDEPTNMLGKTYKVKVQSRELSISGYKSVAFQVYEEAMPLEVIWLAYDLKIGQEFDFRSFSNLLQKLVKGAYSTSFENSNQYFELLDSGYPMMVEMMRQDGNTYISEVIKINKTDFRDTEFKVPVGFTSSSLTDVGVWDMYQ